VAHSFFVISKSLSPQIMYCAGSEFEITAISSLLTVKILMIVYMKWQGRLYLAAGDCTTRLKQRSHFLVIERITKVLHVDVSELLCTVAHHVDALTTSHETTDKPNIADHSLSFLLTNSVIDYRSMVHGFVTEQFWLTGDWSVIPQHLSNSSSLGVMFERLE